MMLTGVNHKNETQGVGGLQGCTIYRHMRGQQAHIYVQKTHLKAESFSWCIMNSTVSQDAGGDRLPE